MSLARAVLCAGLVGTLAAPGNPGRRHPIQPSYDQISKRLVLFGGTNINTGVTFDDTWI